MNTSELIAELKESLKKNGDLPVFRNMDTKDSFETPEEISFYEVNFKKDKRTRKEEAFRIVLQ